MGAYPDRRQRVLLLNELQRQERELEAMRKEIEELRAAVKAARGN